MVSTSRSSQNGQQGSNCISQLALRCLRGFQISSSTNTGRAGSRNMSSSGPVLLDRGASSPTRSTRRNQMTERAYAPPLQVAPKGIEAQKQSKFQLLLLPETSLTSSLIETCAVCADEPGDLRAGCGHAACEACWRTWLGDHDICWLCGVGVKELVREKDIIVKNTTQEDMSLPNKNNAIGIATGNLRQASTLLIKRLVALKHRIMELSASLCEVEEHLRSLASPSAHQFGQSIDAWTAVLAVERKNLTNTALAILALSTGNKIYSTQHDERAEQSNEESNDAQLWLDLETATTKAAQHAQAALDALDDDDNKQENLAYARSVVHDLGLFDVAAAQWSASRAELDSCLSHRLPRLKPLLCGPMDSAAAESAMTAALFGLPVEPGLHARNHTRRRASQPHVFRDPRNLDRALRFATTKILQLDSSLDTSIFQPTQLLAARLESFFPAVRLEEDVSSDDSKIVAHEDDDDTSSGTPLLALKAPPVPPSPPSPPPVSVIIEKDNDVLLS